MLATCLFAIAAAQDQPATMTLETTAQNAPAIVQLVAQASGRSLAATPDMAPEVLLIKVKDADTQGVLDRIAKVTFGKWMDRDGVMTLVPDASARKAASDRTFTETMERIEKVLTAWENPKEAGDEDFGEMSKEEIQEYLAMRKQEQAHQRAFAGLVRTIGVRRIAAMQPGERVVYSDRPTPAQVRLNANWNVFYAVMKERADRGDFSYDGDMGEFGEGMPPEMAEFMAIQRAMAEQNKPFDGTPVKFLLAVQRPSQTGQYAFGRGSANVTLYALDKTGAMAYVSNLSFEGGMAMEELASPQTVGDEMEGEEEQAEPQNPGRPIKFAPEELELGMGVYGSVMPEQTKLKLLASFTDTTKDPLDLIGGTILRRISETADLDLVANVPDGVSAMRYLLSKDYQQHATIEFFIQNMGSSGVGVAEKDGWLEVAPADFDTETNTRMDRPTLATYAAGLAAGNGMKLDSLAEFMYRNPYAASNGLFQTLKEMTPSANSWLGNDNVPMMRLWGSLSPSHRQTLRSGQPVQIGILSKASRDLLSGYVYSTEMPLQMPPPAAMSRYSLPARTVMNMMMFGGGGMFGGGQSWVSEPTESLPQGLPNNGRISVEQWSEICFVPESQGVNMMIPGVLGATEMIMLDAFRSAAPAEAAEVINSMPTRATVGRRTNMGVTIAFTPQIQSNGSLSDIEMSADRRVVSLVSPPADIKEQIDATRKEISVLEAFMKYMVGSIGQGEGGQRPPP